MALTVTLANLRSDVVRRADVEGMSDRYPNADVDRMIRTSIGAFRDLVSQNGHHHYLRSFATTCNIFAPAAKYDAIDIPTPADLVRVYGVDLTVNNREHSLDTFEMAERNAYNDRPSGIPRSFRARFPVDSLQGSNPEGLWVIPRPDKAYAARIFYLPALDSTSFDTDGETYDFINGWEEWVICDVARKILTQEQDAQAFGVVSATLARIEAAIEHHAPRKVRSGPSRVTETRNVRRRGRSFDFASSGGSGAGGGGSGTIQNVQDEGSDISSGDTTLNFIGANVLAAPGAPGVTDITITGGVPGAHAPTHSDGGGDEITVEDLATGSTDVSAALRPDGAGGLAMSDVAHADLTGVGADDHHAESHTIVSHSDTTATGPELETLTDGSNADSLHVHAVLPAHTIASHSDTSGTGPELDTLTDGSNADALHAHAHSGLTGITADDHHAESHTVASHSDTSGTGAELDTLTDGSNADALHAHVSPAHTIASHSDTAATGAELDTLTDGSTTNLHAHSHANITGVTADQHHAESHTVASHSDTTATGAELETLTDGSNADTLHAHAHSALTGIGANDHHAEAHTIASHSDTTATGAELETLTDGSNADALHSHAGGGSGDFSGPAGSTTGNIVSFADATGKLGADSGILATSVSGHIASTANPHATDVGNLGSGTLTELNTAITDATLDTSTAARPPNGSASGDLGGSFPSPTVTDFTLTSEAQGTITYRNATAWVVLPVGTAGQRLTTQGAAANPTWETPSGGASIFGNDYQFAAVESRTTTTSSSAQTKTTLTTGAITGTYLLSWTAIVDNNGSFGEFRFENTTDTTTLDGDVILKSGDADNRISIGGYAQVVFAGVAKTFEIQFNDQSGGNTQGIQQARISIWKVA